MGFENLFKKKAKGSSNQQVQGSTELSNVVVSVEEEKVVDKPNEDVTNIQRRPMRAEDYFRKKTKSSNSQQLSYDVIVSENKHEEVAEKNIGMKSEKKDELEVLRQQVVQLSETFKSSQEREKREEKLINDKKNMLKRLKEELEVASRLDGKHEYFAWESKCLSELVQMLNEVSTENDFQDFNRYYNRFKNMQIGSGNPEGAIKQFNDNEDLWLEAKLLQMKDAMKTTIEYNKLFSDKNNGFYGSGPKRG